MVVFYYFIFKTELSRTHTYGQYFSADEDDVPYELMGQVAVVSIILILIVFSWLADMQTQYGWN